MIARTGGRSRRLLAACACALLALAARGDTLGSALDAAREHDAAARAAQQRVDTLADQTRDLLGEYRATTRNAELLAAYNARMAAQIAGQQARLADLERSLAQLTGLQREVLPLLSSMLDALEQFVALDLPFRQAERKAAVQELRVLLDAPGVDLAEKFRRVLAGYRVEEDYGRTLATWRERIEIDGTPQDVQVLRVGRIALLCRTPDGSLTAHWDAAARGWRVLADASYAAAVRHGVEIAAGAPPEALLVVPVPAPESAR